MELEKTLYRIHERLLSHSFMKYIIRIVVSALFLGGKMNYYVIYFFY